MSPARLPLRGATARRIKTNATDRRGKGGEEGKGREEEGEERKDGEDQMGWPTRSFLKVGSYGPVTVKCNYLLCHASQSQFVRLKDSIPYLFAFSKC